MAANKPSTDPWKKLGATAPRRLVAARNAAHAAAQWVSRAQRAVLSPKSDDSHSNLGWDGKLDAFVSHDLGADGLRLGLQLIGLKILVMKAGETTASLAIGGRGRQEVGRWVGKRLTEAGLDPSGLHDELPYSLEDDPTADGAVYESASQAAELAELTRWFANAADLLEATVVKYAHLKPGPSPVRCWPHHFDIATLITLDEAGGEDARSVGVGLSPGDGNYPQPYFYVSPWPYPAPDKLPALGDGAHWHTEGFTSAITLGHAIVGLSQAELRQKIHAQIDACLNLLGIDA